MPKIDLKTSDEKKLDLSKYFEGDEAYIYIKKIDRLTRAKITYYRFGGTDVKMLPVLKELLKDGKLDPKKKIGNYDIVNMIPIEERESCIENDAKIEELYLLNGIDKTKHNFTDIENKEIDLDILFWDNIANSVPGMIKYVLEEIKLFNNDVFTLKKKNVKKSTGQLDPI